MTDKNKHLECVLSSHKISKEQALLDKHIEKRNAGKEAFVRDQKVSIGIEFYPDVDGDIINIDVVPGRELNMDQYKKDNKLNLYVNQKFGKIEAGSDYIRSNIQAQIDNIKDRATA